jgi:hypothetical protein
VSAVRIIPNTLNTREYNNTSTKINEAIASLSLEGITLSKESIDDLMLFSCGELSGEEVIKKVLSRVRSKSK